MMGIRKLLDYVFEKHELKILDDILPEFKRHEKLDDEEALELGVSLKDTATKHKLILSTIILLPFKTSIFPKLIAFSSTNQVFNYYLFYDSLFFNAVKMILAQM